MLNPIVTLIPDTAVNPAPADPATLVSRPGFELANREVYKAQQRLELCQQDYLETLATQQAQCLHPSVGENSSGDRICLFCGLIETRFVSWRFLDPALLYKLSMDQYQSLRPRGGAHVGLRNITGVLSDVTDSELVRSLIAKLL
jgi:hypothetical protein